MTLLDTDVLVDILRAHPPAVSWLETHPNEPLGVVGISVTELLQGCTNLQEQRRIGRFITSYNRYWISEDGCERALDDYLAHRLSNGLEIIDALIAHTATELGAPLATFNTKHYRVIQGLQLIQPYERRR